MRPSRIAINLLREDGWNPVDVQDAIVAFCLWSFAMIYLGIEIGLWAAGKR